MQFIHDLFAVDSSFVLLYFIFIFSSHSQGNYVHLIMRI